MMSAFRLGRNSPAIVWTSCSSTTRASGRPVRPQEPQQDPAQHGASPASARLGLGASTPCSSTETIACAVIGSASVIFGWLAAKVSSRAIRAVSAGDSRSRSRSGSSSSADRVQQPAVPEPGPRIHPVPLAALRRPGKAERDQQLDHREHPVLQDLHRGDQPLLQRQAPVDRRVQLQRRGRVEGGVQAGVDQLGLVGEHPEDGALADPAGLGDLPGGDRRARARAAAAGWPR